MPSESKYVLLARAEQPQQCLSRWTSAKASGQFNTARPFSTPLVLLPKPFFVVNDIRATSQLAGKNRKKLLPAEPDLLLLHTTLAYELSITVILCHRAPILAT